MTGASGYYEVGRINDDANSEIKFHSSRLIPSSVQGSYKSRRDDVKRCFIHKEGPVFYSRSIVL